MTGRNFTYVEDDELARKSEKRDQEHDFRLDDALMLCHEKLERMIEFERDQKRHDLAEDRLKHPMIQWVDRAAQ